MFYNSISEKELLNNPNAFYSDTDIKYYYEFNYPFIKSKLKYTKYKDYKNLVKDIQYFQTINSSLGNKNKFSEIILEINYKPCFRFLEEIYNYGINKSYKIKLPLLEPKANLNCFQYDEHNKNNEKRLSKFVHKKNNNRKRCVILIHGFGSKNKKIYLQLAERFAKNGIFSVVYSLPFHFDRSIYLNDKKNNYDISDFRATLELFRQTIIELRILIKILKKEYFNSVGILGFSFGGFCASLISCFENNCDFVISIASMGDFSSLKIFKKGKKKLDATNYKDKINDFFSTNHISLISPINYFPIISTSRVMFIQGLFDSRAPILDALKLIKKWNIKKVIFYPCDHFTFFLFNRITMKICKNFIKSL